jgi:hypothetical protein
MNGKPRDPLSLVPATWQENKAELRFVLSLRKWPVNNEDRARVLTLIPRMPGAWGVKEAFLGRCSIIVGVISGQNVVVPRLIHGIPVEIAELPHEENEPA